MIRKKRFLMGFYTDIDGKRKPITKTGFEIILPSTILRKKKCRITMDLTFIFKGLNKHDLEKLGYKITKKQLNGEEFEAVIVEDGVPLLINQYDENKLLMYIPEVEINDINMFNKVFEAVRKTINKIFINTER